MAAARSNRAVSRSEPYRRHSWISCQVRHSPIATRIAPTIAPASEPISSATPITITAAIPN